MEFLSDDDNGDKEVEDCVSLLEQANLQEKELRHKRRWLIGLPTSLSENEEGSNLEIERAIPESLLREDDVSYEIIKSFVEESARECNTKNKYLVFHDDMQLVYSPRHITALLSLIENMTNQALQQFAKVLTNGKIRFEKTRWKMKQIIKEHLLEVYRRQKNNGLMKLCEIHSSLLKNPRNFRWSRESRFIPDSNSYHAAVYKILNVLEELPTQTICAMHRKIKGIKGYKPQLKTKKTGWGREKLIEHLRKKCLKLLSKLNHGDSLQEPLAKAMEVASLNLKLIQGYHYAPNFVQSSAEINSLQNEIATCIKLVDQKVRVSALKRVKVLLDPDAKIVKRALRAPVTNFMTEYLFECADMDTIPQCLLESIAVIRKSCKNCDNCLTESKVEEEVECILSLSASTRQVLWDLNPEHEFDIEFSDAYMEDCEDSDADDFELEEHTGNDVSGSSNLDEKVGSSWDESNSVENPERMAEGGLDEKVGSSWDKSNSVENPECMAEGGSTKEITYSRRVQSMHYHLVNLRNTKQDTDSVKDTDDEHTHIPAENPDLVSCKVSDGQGVCKNRYVALQAASDEASKVAYRLVGHMLNEFAQIEGCELNSHDTSYLGVGDSGLMGKKRKGAREEASTHQEDGLAILTKAIEEIIPSLAKR